MRRLGAALATVALLAGCGGGAAKPKPHRSQAQITACWNQQVNAYAGTYAKSLGIPAQNAEALIIPTVQALESGKTPDPGLTTAAITQRIKQIEKACGKLALKKGA